MSFGCKYTPERGSYYCFRHRDESNMLAFKVKDGGSILVDLEKIKVQPGKKDQTFVRLRLTESFFS